MTRSPLSRPMVERVVSAAPLAHVGVETASGPHVTPAAYAVAAGRIWFVSARSTVKVRALRRRPDVGLLLRAGDEAVVVGGSAEIMSPWGPGDAARALAGSLFASLAAADYATRHPGLLAGYLRDLLACPAGAIPYDRVLVSVRPVRGLVLAGDTVVDSWGRWRGRSGSRAGGRVRRPTGDAADLLSRVPRGAAAALRAGAPPVVGLLAPSGPVVLPARWPTGEVAAVEVARDALATVGPPREGAACICVDAMSGARPSTFAGVLLRGEAAIDVARRRATISLDADRVSWWDGFRTGTVRRPASAAGRRAA